MVKGDAEGQRLVALLRRAGSKRARRKQSQNRQPGHAANPGQCQCASACSRKYMSSDLIFTMSSTYLETPGLNDVAETVAPKPNATGGVMIPVVTPIVATRLPRHNA